uniref:Uncharacterized protein n=1 Tax=Trypanosoma vivax (strain Y486) TaxID=1055687 RepID=G0U9H6_TRYVY|nr:hypothetical protein TVY486_1117460 [Trypanosoma vivax Y486]
MFDSNLPLLLHHQHHHHHIARKVLPRSMICAQGLLLYVSSALYLFDFLRHLYALVIWLVYIDFLPAPQVSLLVFHPVRRSGCLFLLSSTPFPSLRDFFFVLFCFFAFY